MRPRTRRVAIAVILTLTFAASAASVLRVRQGSAGVRAVVAELGAFSAQDIARESYRVVPEMLLVVYDAFGEDAETAIYETLSGVASGGALRALYLERAGAMPGGGLAASDQSVHAMEMTQIDAREAAGGVEVEASWSVVGTVGHATHLHVRGNSYHARLTLSPVEGTWKFTAFMLLDVQRERAGEIYDGTE